MPRKLPTPPARNFVTDGVRQGCATHTKQVPAMVSNTQTPFDVYVVDEQFFQKSTPFFPRVNGHKAAGSYQVINFNCLPRLGDHTAAST